MCLCGGCKISILHGGGGVTGWRDAGSKSNLQGAHIIGIRCQPIKCQNVKNVNGRNGNIGRQTCGIQAVQALRCLDNRPCASNSIAWSLRITVQCIHCGYTCIPGSNRCRQEPNYIIYRHTRAKIQKCQWHHKTYSAEEVHHSTINIAGPI